MKLSVAFFLALTIFTSGVGLQGQTPPRRGNQGTASQPRNETLKICQGVPVPDGYVIIAYMTSAACPHGAYLLKKQNDYESSLAVNGAARQTAEKSTEQTKTQSGTTTDTAKKTGAAKTSTAVRTTPPKPAGNSVTTGPTAATRARRVGNSPDGATSPQLASQPQTVTQAPETEQPQTTQTGPPVLLGSGPARPQGPPTLGNMGSPKPLAAPENSPATTTKPPGEEEVSEGDVLRVETSLVTVPVSVLDRQGRFVPNLKREDFHVFENGVEQEVAYFEPAEKPFTVALVLDTSASTHFHLDDIREGALAFAKQLRPQDRVLIVTFNDEVLLLTEATNDMHLIETVIYEGVNTGSSTRLYDAVDLTIRERLNKIKGRKAIVLFTDGVDTSSQQATYLSTLREVEELDALIYPIQYDTTDYLNAMQNGTVTVTTTRSGLFGMGTTQQTYSVPMNNGVALPGTTKADYARADRYLHHLADKTGGRLYQANDPKQLAQAFTLIAEELRRQYSLGYYPKSDNGESSDRRQIRVKVRQSNLAVKARDGYVKATAPKQ